MQMQISILVIYEKDMDGKGARDLLAHRQIWGSDRRSKPQNWNVLCCSELTSEALQSFRDGMFDFVVVLQAERLTEALLAIVLQKLETKDGLAITVYETLIAAFRAPATVSRNGRCVLAWARGQNFTSSPGVVDLKQLRRYIEGNK